MFSLSPKGTPPQPKDEAEHLDKTQSYKFGPSSKSLAPRPEMQHQPKNQEKDAAAAAAGAADPSATTAKPSRLDMYTNKDERMPHYSRVVDPIETLNPVTGRSIYYGARPWRCDDRVHDWLQSLVAMRFKKGKIAWRTLMECAYSEFGEQPTCPYETLQRQSVMYYVDRQDHGMVRDYMFEKYPFSTRDFVRVMTDDGTKMRVWRHQRELELEAKQGRVDEVIAGGVLPKTKKESVSEKR